MKRVTLYDRVENYLKENGSITSWEAIKVALEYRNLLWLKTITFFRNCQ